MGGSPAYEGATEAQTGRFKQPFERSNALLVIEIHGVPSSTNFESHFVSVLASRRAHGWWDLPEMREQLQDLLLRP